MPLMRGRELKRPSKHALPQEYIDAPYAGARIETFIEREITFFIAMPLMRGRELKLCILLIRLNKYTRCPLCGGEN